MITLTDNEILELTYMQKLGYKYIAKDNDIKETYAYDELPFRKHDCWDTDYGYSILCKLGDYDFLSWNDEPVSIDTLLYDNIKPIELVYPINED